MIKLNREIFQKAVRFAILTIAFVASNFEAFCLSLPAPTSTPPCGGVFGPCIPIDGGISFLLVAGAAYGGKKALDSWKENKHAE